MRDLIRLDNEYVAIDRIVAIRESKAGALVILESPPGYVTVEGRDPDWVYDQIVTHARTMERLP